MTVTITPEIEKAFQAYLDEEVDWDFMGKKILRRHQRQFFDNPSRGLVEFAAGWQAARSALHMPTVPLSVLGPPPWIATASTGEQP